MNDWLPQASTIAGKTDTIFFGLLVVSGLITVLVAGLLGIFAVHYRHGKAVNRSALAGFLGRDIEIGWTLATLFAFVAIFSWAAAQDFSQNAVAPANAMVVHVLAKQWMWKTQHQDGQREINALHVPVHRPVVLVMQSQDVIHSFYVPAFRLKRDVVPGHTEQLSFEASLPGTFPLYCAEFCGADHSVMRGEIVVMPTEEFTRWLASQPRNDELAAEGASVFRAQGCVSCHGEQTTERAPTLRGLYGRRVALTGGRTRIADDEYIRDSIVDPRRDVVAGFQPVMPSYGGTISEADLVRVGAYIRSLAEAPSP